MDTKNKQYTKAFTLVELIVVITILAILATIGFLSFQNISSSARDSSRLSNLTSIKKGLELYSVNNINYPHPDGNVLTGSINGVSLTYVGELGDSVSRFIKINKVPVDPLSNTKYTYGTTADHKSYQIASIMENEIAYNNSNFTNQANAASAKYAYVIGNYNGFLKYSSGSEAWISNLPSLIFNNTGSVDLLSDSTYFVVNKKLNLPYSVGGVKDSSIRIHDTLSLIKDLTKSDNASLTGINITNLTKDNFGTIFTGAILESFNLLGGTYQNTDSLKTNLGNSILGTSTSSNENNDTNIINNSCAERPNISNASFVDGNPTSKNQAWQSTNSSNACYYSCNTNFHLDNNACVGNIALVGTNSGTSATSGIVMSANSNIQDGDLVITSVGGSNNVTTFSPYDLTLTELYDFGNQAGHATYYNNHSSSTKYRVTASKAPNGTFSWFSLTFRNANYISHSSIDYPSGNSISISATNKKRYGYISTGGNSSLLMNGASIVFGSTYLRVYLVEINPNSTITGTIGGNTYSSADIITIEEK